jgi:hypothetical protein
VPTNQNLSIAKQTKNNAMKNSNVVNDELTDPDIIEIVLFPTVFNKQQELLFHHASIETSRKEIITEG